MCSHNSYDEQTLAHDNEKSVAVEITRRCSISTVKVLTLLRSPESKNGNSTEYFLDMFRGPEKKRFCCCKHFPLAHLLLYSKV